MIDEHRHRAESLTQEILHRHEAELRTKREAMVKTHQAEQEQVLAELAEALSYGVRTALNDQAEQLRAETADKVEAMKQESKRKQDTALRELEDRLREESDRAMQQMLSVAEAEMQLKTGRLESEHAAEHAARVNKLQLDLAARRQAVERRIRGRYDEQLAQRSLELEEAIDADIDASVDALEAKLSQKLRQELEQRRSEGSARQVAILRQVERAFEQEAAKLRSFTDEFFAGSVDDSEPSSPAASSRHMPTTKKAIQARLSAISDQYSAYKNRFKRSARELAKMQDEIVELRRELRSKNRALAAAQRRHGSGRDERSRTGTGKGRQSSSSARPSSPRGISVDRASRSELEATAQELYRANQRLIEHVGAAGVQ